MTKLEKLSDDNYIINKNKNFFLLIEKAHAIYNEIISDLKKHSKQPYKEKKTFINLINNLKEKNKTSIVSKNDLQLLVNWIDIICILLLEKESVNLKDVELNTFFKLSEQFIKQANMILAETQV